jgi:hypothetical protein
MVLRRIGQIVMQVYAKLQLMFALPHELLHYLPMQPWSKTIRIKSSIPKSEWTRAYLPPPAEVTGEFEKTIPTSVLQFASLAPTIIFSTIGGLIGSFGPFRFSFVSFLGFSFIASWAAPSPTDVSTFRNAEKYRRAGTLDADVPVETSSIIGAFLIIGLEMFTLLSLWFPQ